MCGLLTGAVNGLFGAGGGMLAVPVLTYVAGLDERKSHATAIAVILPLCIISTIVYALQGGFDYSIFRLLSQAWLRAECSERCS